MKSGLDQLFAFNEAVLRVRAQRQGVLASNIANADTPHYKARDIDFQSALSAATRSAGQAANAADLQPMQTSANHMQLAASSNALGERTAALVYRTTNQPSIDGNTVDLDVERAQFADNALRYQATAQFLSGQARSMLLAINGQ
jgi:flagellar basal-body rod protein FlgB